MHGRVRHGDYRARGGDLDQLKPSLNFGLVLGGVAGLRQRLARAALIRAFLRCGASNCPHGAATAV
jgi:hypothetical protein